MVSSRRRSPSRVVVVLWLVITGLALAATLRDDRTEISDSFPLGVEPAPNYTIAGRADGPLHPGAVRALDLTFNNPHDEDMLLTDLGVAVAGVRAPRATDDLPCTGADYRAGSGDLPPLKLPARDSVSLDSAGVPRHHWPTLEMLNTGDNQDGCKDAEVLLDYRADLEAAE